MGLAHWYALALVRLRWAIVAGWLVLAVALSMTLPTLEQGGDTGGFSGFASPDNPAIQTQIRSFEKFGFPVLTRTAVVQRNPEGLSPETQLRLVTNAIEFNLEPPPELERIEFALPVINDFGLLPTGEQGTTAITYLYFRPDVNFLGQTNLAKQYAERYAGQPSDHLVGTTGVIPGRISQLAIIRDSLETVEIATVGLVFLVVALSFKAIGAPLVTMATAGLALSIIIRVAGWLGQEFGFEVPKEIEPVMVALMLGIITDYSIFFLSGMRERLAAGDHRLDAARDSTREFAPIVFVAGLTVATGSLALLVSQVEVFRSFGPGMAVTILIGMLVAVTFVPACLAILGRAVFWPRPPQVTPATGRIPRSRVVELVTRKRVALPVVVVGTMALLGAAAPVGNLDLGFGVIDSLPESDEVSRATDAAAQGFMPGIVAPMVMLVEGPDITERRAALDRLQELLEQRPGLASVTGPGDQPSPVSLGAVLSTSGDAARYVILLGNAPLNAAAISDLHELSEDMPALLAQVGIPDAQVSFAGDTALAQGIVTQTEDDLGRIVLVATGLGFVLLVLFLRALVAPLYLMAVNVLAVSATLGLTTLVFQTIAGQSGITFYVPFAAAVLLVALGADYSIFGVGYIWAEARDRPLIEAIRVAVPRSTKAISAAGVALALSFGALAVVPLSPFREFAFAMSVGIFIDVFVVRSFLVPSFVSLVGMASAWPGHSLRRRGEPAPVAPAARPALQGAAVAGGGPGKAGSDAEPAVSPPERTGHGRRRRPLMAYVLAGAVLAEVIRSRERRSNQDR